MTKAEHTIYKQLEKAVMNVLSNVNIYLDNNGEERPEISGLRAAYERLITLGYPKDCIWADEAPGLIKLFKEEAPNALFNEMSVRDTKIYNKYNEWIGTIGGVTDYRLITYEHEVKSYKYDGLVFKEGNKDNPTIVVEMQAYFFDDYLDKPQPKQDNSRKVELSL